MNKNLKVMFY